MPPSENKITFEAAQQMNRKARRALVVRDRYGNRIKGTVRGTNKPYVKAK